MNHFSKELIQAVSDWQMASNTERGVTLQREALKLNAYFRKTDVTCYRRLDLQDPSLRTLGTNVQLTEKISSWTLEASVARKFNNGIPTDPKYQGLIFSLNPATLQPPSSIILDLTRLFSDEDFLKAVQEHKKNISDFNLGMGHWWDKEREVVIELDILPLSSLCLWGGYSSSRERIITQLLAGLGRPATAPNRIFAAYVMRVSGIKTGAWWLSNPEGLKRAADKLKALCAGRCVSPKALP